MTKSVLFLDCHSAGPHGFQNGPTTWNRRKSLFNDDSQYEVTRQHHVMATIGLGYVREGRVVKSLFDNFHLENRKIFERNPDGNTPSRWIITRAVVCVAPVGTSRFSCVYDRWQPRGIAACHGRSYGIRGARIRIFARRSPAIAVMFIYPVSTTSYNNLTRSPE
jgi:hypothetical protein